MSLLPPISDAARRESVAPDMLTFASNFQGDPIDLLNAAKANSAGKILPDDKGEDSATTAVAPNQRSGSIWNRLRSVNPPGNNAKVKLPAIDAVKEQPDQGDSKESVEDPDKEGGNKQKKFRVLARMIKTNLAWAKDLHTKKDDEPGAFIVKSGGGSYEEPLIFDLNNFKANSSSYGGLTSRTRRILLNHPLNRTEDDLRILRDVVDRLKCFARYRQKVKQALASVIFYESVSDGRVVIQQGHHGTSFYFIIRGKVTVKVLETDKKTGIKTTQVLGELGEGSSFGELALIHNIRRTATVVCKGDCEFLRVDKPDFEEVLRTSYQQDWDERLILLKKIKYFKDMKEPDMIQLNNLCKQIEYSANQVICTGDTSKSDHLLFVIMGECVLTRVVYLVRDQKKKGLRLSTDREMLRIEEEISQPNRTLHDRRDNTHIIFDRRVWQVCVLSHGSHFSAGENLKDTYIVSRGRTDLLAVPKVQILRYFKSKMLDNLKAEMEEIIPSTEEVFRRYLMDLNWDKYKRSVVKEVAKKSKVPSNTTYEDVPESIKAATWCRNIHNKVKVNKDNTIG